MPNTQEKLSSYAEEKMPHHIPNPIWDPVPDWLKLDEKRLHEFGKLQIQSKLKELELKKAKLEQLQNLMGK
jgi:hypothetical protein